jgi:hypothetical protein
LTYFTGNAVLTYTGANPWTYGNAGGAAVYSIEDGAHVWRNAPSGTAGNAISFTQAMTLTAAGNLALGTTSPAEISNYVTQTLNGTSGSFTEYRQSGVNTFRVGTDSTGGFLFTQSTTAIKFGTNDTERARIDTSGTFIFNKTTAGDGTVGSYISGGGTISTTRSESTNSTPNYVLYSTGAGNYRFYVGMGGNIYATSTSISAISDRTLKENIRDLETGLPEVMALKPRRFDWKNGDAQNVAGFVAQEVEEVLPELVTDYVYNKGDDGNDIIKKSLKMGDILPTLVKAIQEQQAIIEQLKADVAALKGNP